MDEGPKGYVEVHSASLTVVEELLLDGDLGLTNSATTLASILQLKSNGPEDLQEDHTIHPPLVRDSERDSERHGVGEDVVV